MPGGTFPVHLRIYIPFFQIKIQKDFSKALQLHYMPAFSIQQACMLVYGSTGDHMLYGMSNFFLK